MFDRRRMTSSSLTHEGREGKREEETYLGWHSIERDNLPYRVHVQREEEENDQIDERMDEHEVNHTMKRNEEMEGREEEERWRTSEERR